MPVLSNPKHERFAQELVKGATADQAYVSAGYKQNRFNAARLNTNEHIRARVEEILNRIAQKVEAKVEATLERTLEEISRISYADIGLAFDWDGQRVTLKKSSELPPEVRACISEVKQTKDGVSIKFHPKTAALDMLAKHFGIYKAPEANVNVTIVDLVRRSFEVPAIPSPEPFTIEHVPEAE